ATSMVAFRLSRPFGASTVDMLKPAFFAAADRRRQSRLLFRLFYQARDQVPWFLRSRSLTSKNAQSPRVYLAAYCQALSIGAMTNHSMGCNCGNFSVADIGTAALVLWAPRRLDPIFHHAQLCVLRRHGQP